MGWEDGAERAAERAANRAADRAAKRVGKGISDFGSSIAWTVGFGLLFVGVFGCVICGGGGYVAWVVMSGSPGGGDFGGPVGSVEEATWDGASTFSCGGNDKVSLNGVTATLDDIAIDAGGNCKLTLEDMNLTAATAIKAGGNAKITVTGGSVTGSKYLVDAGGNAKIDFSGVTTSGEVKTGGLAKVTGAK